MTKTKQRLGLALVAAWIALGGVLARGGGVSPETAKPAAKAASPLVAEKSTIDAGDVLRGQPAKFSFVLKNTAARPVEIAAKTSCGCTVAKFDKTLAAGGTGKVEVELRTSGLRGQIHKTITVTTDDPSHAPLQLTLAAHVRSIVEVERPSGKVLALKENEPTVEEFRVHVRGGEAVQVSGVTCRSPQTRLGNPRGARANTGGAKTSPGNPSAVAGEGRVASPHPLPLSRPTGEGRVAGSSPVAGEGRKGVRPVEPLSYAKVAFELLPAEAGTPGTEASKPDAEKQSFPKGRSEAELRNEAIDLGTKAQDLRPKTQDPARAYRVRLEVAPTAPTGRYTISVVIATDSKTEPTLVVPIACEKGIVASPASVFLGSLGPQVQTPVTRTVVVRRREGAFKILKVQSSDPSLQVREQSLGNGSLHTVSVSYRGGAAPGVGRGKLLIETDDPHQPRLEIVTLYVVPGKPPAPPKTMESTEHGAGSSEQGARNRE